MNIKENSVKVLHVLAYVVGTLCLQIIVQFLYNIFLYINTYIQKEKAVEAGKLFDMNKYVKTNSSAPLMMLVQVVLGIILTLVLYSQYLKHKKERVLNIGDKKSMVIYSIIFWFVSMFVISLIEVFVIIIDKNSKMQICSSVQIKVVIEFLIFWMFQGCYEELVYRGLLNQALSSEVRPEISIVINSICFALIHLNNKGATVLAITNLFIFGLCTSLITCKFNLLAACAFHSAWNFTQCNFFNGKVSGIINSDSSIFKISLGEGNVLNGDQFGLEGSIFSTCVLIPLLIILLIVRKPRLKGEEENA